VEWRNHAIAARCRRATTGRQRDAVLIGRAGTEYPPLRLGDPHVVDARLAATHQPFGGELPQLLAQRVVQLARSLAAQELDDLGPAGDELVALRHTESSV